jgi:hypothetical protein
LTRSSFESLVYELSDELMLEQKVGDWGIVSQGEGEREREQERRERERERERQGERERGGGGRGGNMTAPRVRAMPGSAHVWRCSACSHDAFGFE